MYVCMYPSSANSFDPIMMKLGMDTPWDFGSVMGQVASPKPEARGSEAIENASAKREARENKVTAGVGKVALRRCCATHKARNKSKG